MILFLDISSGELLLIFFAFLILFGPKSIPTLAQTLGRWLFTLRNAQAEIQREIFKTTSKVNHYIQNTRDSIEQKEKSTASSAALEKEKTVDN